jgi:hypothetical protein
MNDEFSVQFVCVCVYVYVCMYVCVFVIMCMGMLIVSACRHIMRTVLTGVFISFPFQNRSIQNIMCNM